MLFRSIVQEEGEAYVWASNDKDKLEKRTVELGEYDEELGAYEITGGLTEKDAIAFPMEGLYEGVATVTDISEVDYSSPLYNQEGEDGENAEDGEMMDEEGVSDEFSEDASDEMIDDLPEGRFDDSGDGEEGSSEDESGDGEEGSSEDESGDGEEDSSEDESEGGEEEQE